jgi:hypothetical protein
MNPHRMLLLAVLLVLLAGGNAEVKTKPGGKVSATYGSPTWNAGFEGQMKPGTNWRLGSNAATTVTTEGAIVFDDCVVFPGQYNLAMVCRTADQWALVFHNDGIQYGGEKNAGQSILTMTRVDEKQASKQLQIDLEADKATKGQYLWRVTFGPHRVEKPFTTARTKDTKAKIGKHKVTASWLVLDDLEGLATSLEKSDVCLARLESPSLVRGPLKASLRGGSDVQLILADERANSVPRRIPGQAGGAEKASKSLELVLEGGDDKGVLTFVVGAQSYVFELPPDVFEPAQG